MGAIGATENMGHIRQSRPNYGLGFHVKSLTTFEVSTRQRCVRGGGDRVGDICELVAREREQAERRALPDCVRERSDLFRGLN